MTDSIEILVGSDSYRLSNEDARWLIQRLRETYTDTDGSEEEPAFVLAWALELALEQGGDPIKLGLPQVVPVPRVAQAAERPPSATLIALQNALLRLQLGNA